jgi:hypothetical protein
VLDKRGDGEAPSTAKARQEKMMNAHPLARMLGEMFGTKPKRSDPEASQRARFRRLAKKHGLTFVRTRDDYIEIEPCDAFPHGLTTTHHHWGESAERVEHCLANSEAVVVENGRGYYSE